jgi:hypothetical protein
MDVLLIVTGVTCLILAILGVLGDKIPENIVRNNLCSGNMKKHLE